MGAPRLFLVTFQAPSQLGNLIFKLDGPLDEAALDRMKDQMRAELGDVNHIVITFMKELER